MLSISSLLNVEYFLIFVLKCVIWKVELVTTLTSYIKPFATRLLFLDVRGTDAILKYTLTFLRTRVGLLF